MTLKYVASIDHVHKHLALKNLISNFHQLKQSGKKYGWLNATGLAQSSHYYIMHFTYYSQLYPVYAPDACEAVSLRMALSAKGFHIPVSTKTFINRIPRSKNPNNGYTNNPYKYGDSATINPKGLIKYAKRYGAKVKDLTGCNKKTFIKNIKHGNPIVFEGAYQMRQTTSDHVLIIVGYRSGHPGQFLIADPFQRKSQNNHVFWVSTTDFMKIYRSSLRQEHALAVVGKLPKHRRHKKHKKHNKHKIPQKIKASHKVLKKMTQYKYSYYAPTFSSNTRYNKYSPIRMFKHFYVLKHKQYTSQYISNHHYPTYHYYPYRYTPTYHYHYAFKRYTPYDNTESTSSNKQYQVRNRRLTHVR